MRMPWLAGMNLGISGFDDDHRHLLEVLEALRTSIADGDLSSVRALFEELRTTTLNHFREEEELMIQLHYPGADDHIAEHERDRHALMRLRALIADGCLDRLAEALAEYSSAYFRGVLHFDSLLVRYVRERAAMVSAEAVPRASGETWTSQG
ncbi:MAG TPA: hemerythrin family protein [Magnetospirillum sp.]|nr:hemerythrin family protein [Magnetospirillum sp.]